MVIQFRKEQDDQYPTNYTVWADYSMDGGEWTNFVDELKASKDAYIKLEEDLEAKYIRLKGTND